MAKEFAFHQFRGDRTAVNRDKRAVAARALQMDHSGHQFLTTAGLTTDEDRRLASGQFSGLVAQFFDLGGFSKQQAGLIGSVFRICFGLREPEGAIHQFP